MNEFQNDDMTPPQQLQWYFDQAEDGDERAMRELGRMYLRGFTHPEDLSVGVVPDAKTALPYLHEAVELGDGEAALLLGEYYDGEATDGFVNEPGEAFTRYQQSVDLGCDQARFYLASRYLIGRGVERDEQKGREIMIEAAYRGIIDAQNFMATIYRKSGDERKALIWEVVASVFDEDRESVGTQENLSVHKDDLEEVRFAVQRVNVYMQLVVCDDPQLMVLADQMRRNFLEEI